MPASPDEIGAVAHASQQRQVVAKSHSNAFVSDPADVVKACILLALGITAPIVGPLLIACISAAILAGVGPSTAPSFIATAAMSFVALTTGAFLGSLAGVRSSKYCGSESRSVGLGFVIGIVALAFAIAIFLFVSGTLYVTVLLAVLYLGCGYITPFFGPRLA